jgi:hypothetical protein
MAVRTNKAEWLAQRLADEQARGLYGTKHYDWATGQWLNANNTPTKGPKPPNPFGREGSLSKQIQEQVSKTVSNKFNEEKRKLASGHKRLTRDEIKNAAKAGKTLFADVPSECFSEVYWEATDDDGQDGICTMEFARDGYVLDESMSLEEFLQFASESSLGRYYNSVIR